MTTLSLGRMLLERLRGHQVGRRGQRRLPQISALSHSENLEPRLLMTADPDDQIRDAISLGTITTPVTRNDSINVPIDVDIYRVDVSAGQRLSFDIDRPAGSRLDSYLRLFNSAGQQLAFNDDGAAPGEVRGLDSYLEYTFASSGSYFLGVSGYRNQTYNAVTGLGDRNGSTGNYGLVISDITPGDPDDQISEAINLGEAGQPITQTGTIDVPTDVDMFRFTLNTTRRVQIDIDRPSGNLDSFLRLFDSNGVELARNDDGPTPGEASSVESYLDVNLSAGTYFVAVSGFGNSSFNALTGTGDTPGSIGNYSITVVSDSDSDDQISEAIDLGAVSGTVTRTGAIDVGTDVDMFRVTVTSGQTVRFDVDALSQTFDSYIRLFDANGNELARNDDGPTPGEGASLESYLEFTFASGGSYFLGVSGYGNSNYSAVSGSGDLNGSSGEYTLEVSLGNVDPPPPPPPPPPPGSGNRVLYLNFDGANISRTDLVRWAGSDWARSVDSLDADRNGIIVQPLLSSRSDREQIISQIITMVQTDLNPFGIRVVRHTGGAVENQGVTTIFLGRSTLTNNLYHVANDIDFGNNNRTDIAFVGDENWGSATNTAIALSDVTLHEAGHTFGLYHVQSGDASESMGLRYSTPQSEWLRDTRFVDQAFNELPGHGGGRGLQNTYQTMLGLFPPNGSSPAGSNGVTPLSPQEVRNILLAGYGHGPHNLPIQDGFAPGGEHDDHDHDDHHDEIIELNEAIAVASRQEAMGGSMASRSLNDVMPATMDLAERLARADSNSVSESLPQLSSHNDEEFLTSANHADQFHSDSWNSLVTSLQSLA